MLEGGDAQLGSLVFFLAYQFTAPIVFHKHFSVLGFVPLILFPVCMAVFLFFRMEGTATHLWERNAQKIRLVSVVDEITVSSPTTASATRRSTAS